MPDIQNEKDRGKKIKAPEQPPRELPGSWPALIWALLLEPRVRIALIVGGCIVLAAGVALQFAGYDLLAFIGIQRKGPKPSESEFKIAYFYRYMQIRSWVDWTKAGRVEGPIYDRVVHEDTILLEPTNQIVTLKDRSTVRGRIFIDYILGGKYVLTNREEYEQWSNRSIIEYQISIPPSGPQYGPVVRRRFSYENNLPRELRAPSQAGLRVPANAANVEAILDLSFLDSSLRPDRVECRVGIPSDRGGLQERSSIGEAIDNSKAIYLCAEKNLPAGSQLIVQWIWPEPQKP